MMVLPEANERVHRAIKRASRCRSPDRELSSIDSPALSPRTRRTASPTLLAQSATFEEIQERVLLTFLFQSLCSSTHLINLHPHRFVHTQPRQLRDTLSDCRREQQSLSRPRSCTYNLFQLSSETLTQLGESYQLWKIW